MNNTSEKKAGISLLVFTILLVFTMVLHPAGGSVEHLIRITGMIVVTHSIAILSLPFAFIGFWGLTQKIGTDRFGSILAFAMISLGLVAALLAAATNGLVLPIFLQSYKDASPETIDAIRPILRYSFAINHAFDYVYTGTFCLAILGWSIEIVRGRKLPVLIGWLGIVLFIAIVVLLVSGMAVNHLMGFRIFVASILVWIAIVGAVLYKQDLV
jgi:hypothetical protein